MLRKAAPAKLMMVLCFPKRFQAWSSAFRENLDSRVMPPKGGTQTDRKPARQINNLRYLVPDARIDEAIRNIDQQIETQNSDRDEGHNPDD